MDEHGEQVTFDFYIALSTLITTGLFASFHKDFRAPSLGFALGLLLMVFSFVFWKSEQRNRTLIWHGEEALKLLEDSLAGENAVAEKLKVFRQVDNKTGTQKRSRSAVKNFWTYPYSYSNCFDLVFCVFALMGFVGAFASVGFVGLLPAVVNWLISVGCSSKPA